MKFTPHNYQFRALSWLIDQTILNQANEGGAYFLDPGLGKTSISLAWLRLLRMTGLSKRALVVAPLRVVYSVWPQEVKKWQQFSDMTTSIVHGTPKQRARALSTPSDLYLINPEGIPWLQSQSHKFDTLILDESTKFKSWGSARTKALRKMLPNFRYRLILTGTPATNGLSDLFPQIYALDFGQSVGANITQFRKRYFYRGGFGGYEWKPIKGAQEKIEQKIAHLCFRLSAADHLELPECLINDVWVDLPEKIKPEYRKLEREMFLALDEGQEIVATNAGGKYLLCKQYAGGAVYDENKNVIQTHSAKIDAITDIVNELHGKPVLIVFNFIHELTRLQSAFPGIKSIYGGTKAKTAEKTIDDWNAGKVHLLAVQPKSLSHGINMQAGPGRDIVWLGLTDSLEEYQQLNKRIHRQGVKGDVRIHRILTRHTVDEAVRDRIEAKEQSQNALLDALNEYRKRRDE